ncbi:MAG: DUF1810 domain-containing protein [Trueperaceae bacterium]
MNGESRGGVPADADAFSLQRFLDAQDRVYAAVTSELRAGRKRSHWMWFVFPQVAGLGVSPTARRYAIGSLAEAQAYLHHRVLGGRLMECTELVLTHTNTPIGRIFGDPDDLKLRSCLTLFAEVAETGEMAGAEEGEGAAPTPFRRALDVFFEGLADERTLAVLEGWRRGVHGADG